MARHLRPQEKVLLRKMLNSTGDEKGGFLRHLDSIFVEEMDDGGMGGVRFVSPGQKHRRLGDTIAEAEFLDEDGVVVTAVINLDKQGELYELDIWKVDFSPLKVWPEAGQIVVKEIPRSAQ